MCVLLHLRTKNLCYLFYRFICLRLKEQYLKVQILVSERFFFIYFFSILSELSVFNFKCKDFYLLQNNIAEEYVYLFSALNILLLYSLCNASVS